MNEVTQKMGMSRKTAHQYIKLFDGDYGQVRDVLIVEATWLGYYEPFTIRSISSFIYEMMVKANRQQVAEEYGLMPFEAQVLEPTRTLCEKIMSLVRFSYGELPIEDLKKKIRHVYDLHQLLKNTEILNFFQSEYFDEMLLKVAQDDVISFKNNNKWLIYHPKEALVFENAEKIWEEIKDTYNDDFRFMVFGKQFPDDIEILSSLRNIANRIAEIKWDINIEV